MADEADVRRVRGRSRGLRWCAAGALVLVFSLTSAGGVRRSEAGFVAILAQTKVYLNILIDEWEKYSRILEDHLDKVTGVMQPFNEIHAGVRELMNLNRLRGVWRMADSYRASVSDPRCFDPTRAHSMAGCTFQRDFTPPEAYEVQMQARWGILDGRYRLEDLESRVFDRSGLDTAQEAAMGVLRILDPAAAAEAAYTQARIERNIQRNRWQLRRMRTLGARGRYASRNFLFRAGQRPGPNPRAGAANDGCPDVPADYFGDAVRGVAPDPDATILDQAINADCQPSSGSLGDPLAEQAHLSEMEAKTLRTAAMVGIVDMAATQLERDVAEEEQAIESVERIEVARREELDRLGTRLACLNSAGTFAYVDSTGACGAVVSKAQSIAAYDAQNVSMLTR